MAAKFRASGQTCVCANRVYVQNGIADRFIERFDQMIQQRMVPGDPLASDTTFGTLISSQAREKVERLVHDAQEKGALIVSGGQRDQAAPPTFFPPTILDRMSPIMQASREELFGPVVAFYRFATEEELLSMANDAEVGLASYVYTENITQAWRAAELLQSMLKALPQGTTSLTSGSWNGWSEHRHGIGSRRTVWGHQAVRLWSGRRQSRDGRIPEYEGTYSAFEH